MILKIILPQIILPKFFLSHSFQAEFLVWLQERGGFSPPPLAVADLNHS
jgi:hypothetical protein